MTRAKSKYPINENNGLICYFIIKFTQLKGLNIVFKIHFILLLFFLSSPRDMFIDLYREEGKKRKKERDIMWKRNTDQLSPI